MPPFSRHHEVYDDLLRRIQSGEWQVGDKFPTVDDFIGNYDLSRGVIFKGIKKLSDAGYLTVRKGRSGTVVARITPIQNVGILIRESVLHPKNTPFPYVLSQKIATALMDEDFSVSRYIERKGTEFSGHVSIEHFANALKNRSLQGLIMTCCNFPFLAPNNPFWREYQIPYVTIHTYGESKFDVNFDYETFFLMAFQHLLAMGKKRIAMFCDNERFLKAENAMKSFSGITVMPEWKLQTTLSPSHEQDGFELMTRLWRQKKRPEALIVTDDIVTKGVAQAILQMGIKVPDDLMIIHGANSQTDVFYPLKMPKLEFDLDETVKEAVALLKYSIANSGSEVKGISRKISPKLVEVN